MRHRRFIVMCVSGVLAIIASRAGAQQETFDAFLSGLNEVGPNGSPGSGFGTVILNAAHTQITVDENWSGLTAPATASHIHGPAMPGVNAAVLFPLSGVPAATAGAIPEQTFAITPTQVTQLESGLFYMNVHTAIFPGGEIRGQLEIVPEPSSFVLLGMGGTALCITLRRRRRK